MSPYQNLNLTLPTIIKLLLELLVQTDLHLHTGGLAIFVVGISSLIEEVGGIEALVWATNADVATNQLLRVMFHPGCGTVELIKNLSSSLQ